MQAHLFVCLLVGSMASIEIPIKIKSIPKPQALQLRSVPSEKVTSDQMLTLLSGSISVGFPSQALEVYFFFGSPNLFLMAGQGTGWYNSDQSWTAGTPGQDFCIYDYFNGVDWKVCGVLEADMIKFAGVRVWRATFGALSPPAFLSLGNTGFLGLGGETIMTVEGATPFVEYMHERGHLQENSVSLYLGNNSALYLGGVNSAYFEGELQYVSMNATNLHFLIDELRIGNFSASNLQGSLDITNSAFSAAMYGKIIEQIPSYSCPQGISTLPTLTLVIGGVEYTMTGEDYTEVLNPDWYECYGGFTVVEDPNTADFVLGNLFLIKYYTSVDFSNGRIGFALGK